MELIEDMESCKELVNKRKVCHSNCFFMLDKMKELVEGEKLYYHQIEDNFLILHREPSFYRVYYFIRDLRQLCIDRLDMPAVIEFPFREVLTEDQKNQINFIEKMGFHVERESARMKMGVEEFDYNRRILNSPDLKIEFAVLEDTKEICCLFDEKFNKLFSFLLSEDEMAEQIKKHSVIAAYYKNEMIGALNFEMKGNLVNINQTAVKNAGSGIGWLILYRLFEVCRGKAKTVRLWVDLCNRRAISMYKKAGFTFDGCRANEYVYRPEYENTI